jgi:multicomponent Na+:H+ antiporter subunit E
MRLRLPGLLIWLVILWIFLWGEFSWANVISGVVVGFLIVLGSGIGQTTTVHPDDRARISPFHLLKFIVYVLFKLVQSNLVLAWEIVTPRNKINSGILAIQLRTESALSMAVVANVITLTPGTMTLESKGSPATLYVNVLHLHDLEQVRKELLYIEDLSVRAFGSRRARAQMSRYREDAAS